MIQADKRKAVFLLHQDGMSLREIVRRLHLSRNTVRTILKQKGEMPLGPRRDKMGIDEDLLRRLYAECQGWMERMHEKLVEEHGVEVSYSTVCRRGAVGLAKAVSRNAANACPISPVLKCNTTPALTRFGWAPRPRC